jgi:glycosyltransferase involved in cell wall biosynthesis
MPAPSGRPRLLFLAHLLPWPLEGGGQIKSYHTLRLLSSRYDITLLALLRRAEEVENVEPLRPLCAGGVETVLLAPAYRRSLSALSSSWRRPNEPLLLRRDDAADMHAAVRRDLAGANCAAIHVDHLQMMCFVPEGRSSDDPPVILDQHNVEYRIPERLAAAPGTPPLLRALARREAPRLRRAEQAACRRADRVLAVSEQDAAAFTDLIGHDRADRVRVTPIGVDTDTFSPQPHARRPGEKPTILTVGTMYWPPNVEGVLWFHAEVLPAIRRFTPSGVRFVIAGARPNASVRALAGTDVEVTGTVPDVRPLMAGCDVFVAPLRAGSGVRVKILNALAMGLPIVSTTVGAEGIDVTDGQDILLADDPNAFAQAVVRVLREPDLAARLRTAARELAVRRYAWDVVGESLLRVYDELLDPRSAAASPA